MRYQERKVQVRSGIFNCFRKQEDVQKTNEDISNEHRNLLEEVSTGQIREKSSIKEQS